MSPTRLPELADWLFFKDMRPDPSIETTLARAATSRCSMNCGRSPIARFWRSSAPVPLKHGLIAACVWPSGSISISACRCGYSEVRAIARSVAKWTWRHFSEQTVLTASIVARQARQREAMGRPRRGATDQTVGGRWASAAAPTTSARKRNPCARGPSIWAAGSRLHHRHIR